MDDEEDEVMVRVEREDTVVPPPHASTPFVAQGAMVTTVRATLPLQFLVLKSGSLGS